jgi:hypothetical protein
MSTVGISSYLAVTLHVLGGPPKAWLERIETYAALGHSGTKFYGQPASMLLYFWAVLLGLSPSQIYSGWDSSRLRQRLEDWTTKRNGLPSYSQGLRESGKLKSHVSWTNSFFTNAPQNRLLLTLHVEPSSVSRNRARSQPISNDTPTRRELGCKAPSMCPLRHTSDHVGTS